MWHVSPLSSLISHSSLDAFLKDHRNVSFKTCLVNFLDPEAYASNLSNFLFFHCPLEQFLFPTCLKQFSNQDSSNSTFHPVMQIVSQGLGDLGADWLKLHVPPGNCPRGVPGMAGSACSTIQDPEFLPLRHSTGTLLLSRQRAELHSSWHTTQELAELCVGFL